MASSTAAKMAEKVRGMQGKPPKDIQDRIDRGRERLRKISQKRNQCLEFWRGNQYVFVNQENLLVQTPTAIAVTPGVGKPPHKARTTRNMIVDVVAHETSASTQRVPSYEINPTTTDPEDIAAASLSEKVALYGYDRWMVRKATVKVVEFAVIAAEGFVWPYFDNTRGRTIDGNVSEGEVCLRVFGPNEVFWEPGVKFEESRWHAVEQARPPEDIAKQYNLDPKALKPDATTNSLVGKQEGKTRMVLVTDYLERPSPQNPQGQRLVLANQKVLSQEPYPCQEFGPDEMALYRLSYFTDPESDRDMGLVEHLLDAQRTINDCTNKQLDWKNLALYPQVILKNVQLDEPLTDQPGAVYHAYGSGDVNWRPVPQIPRELQEMKNEGRNDIGRIAAQNDIPSQVDTATGLQAFIERDQNRRQEFIANLADFHSRVMRHCLYLVQKHYTEDRLLQIRGRFGWEFISDFRGAQLRDQIDVRVLPSSLEPRSRASISQQILAFADRGWITPQAAMAAIMGGMAESLVEDYQLDVAWANHCIQLLKGMADHSTLPDQVPEAREQDNHAVQIHVLTSWMKTQDYAIQDPGVQEATKLLVQQHKDLEAQDAAREQAMQVQTAQQLGLANATRPPSAGMPSQPGSSGTPPPQNGNGSPSPSPTGGRSG